AALSASALECARTRFAPAIARERLAALYEAGAGPRDPRASGVFFGPSGTAKRAQTRRSRQRDGNRLHLLLSVVSGYSRRSSSVRRSRGRREMTIPSASRVTSTISGRDAIGSEPT